MKKEIYQSIESHMLQQMEDSAHDREHVYRVLYLALDIASFESSVNLDVLIAASLLHDIGRPAQIRNSQLCHAEAGAKMAAAFLQQLGLPAEFVRHTAACIRSHRFRKSCLPETIEAKILFDADKVDVSGAMGIARTLLYGGKTDAPLYLLQPDGSVSDGVYDETPSFFGEYCHKLSKIYGTFYTKRAAEIAGARQTSAEAFCRNLLQEAKDGYTGRTILLQNLI